MAMSIGVDATRKMTFFARLGFLGETMENKVWVSRRPQAGAQTAFPPALFRG